jgi:transposase
VLLCRSLAPGAGSGTACCRLAPFHHGEGALRARRYPSDTTDAHQAAIDPVLPDPAWLAGHGGRPEVHCRRAIVDAIFSVADNGIMWRALPMDFPPWSTVYHYFAAWKPPASPRTCSMAYATVRGSKSRRVPLNCEDRWVRRVRHGHLLCRCVCCT